MIPVPYTWRLNEDFFFLDIRLRLCSSDYMDVGSRVCLFWIIKNGDPSHVYLTLVLKSP